MARNLKNKWNCLKSFVQGCHYSFSKGQAVNGLYFHPVDVNLIDTLYTVPSFYLLPYLVSYTLHLLKFLGFQCGIIMKGRHLFQNHGQRLQ